jgi:hypothetical protein
MSELLGNDLGTIVKHSVTQTNNHSNGSNRPFEENIVRLRVAVVVIQQINGTAHLVLVLLHPTLNTEHYIRTIQEEYFYALCKIKRPSWSSIFTKSIISTAQINQVQEAEWHLRSID